MRSASDRKRAALVQRFPYLAGTPWRAPTEIVVDDVDGGRLDVSDRNVWFEEVRLAEVDFSDTRFGDSRSSVQDDRDPRERWRSVSVHGCTFERCDFRGAVFDIVNLGWRRQCVYRDCDFSRAKMHALTASSTLTLGDARFERCTFEGATINGWFTHEAEFVDCVFAGKITGSVFFGKPEHEVEPARKVNEFRGNDFRRIEFVNTDFRNGVVLSAQLLPSDDEHVLVDRLVERLPAAREIVSTWPESDVRSDAEVLLQIWTDDLERTGQSERLLRRNEPKSSFRDVQRRLIEVFETR